MSEPNPAPVTPERLLQFAFGFAPPLIIESALRFRVFDILDTRPRTLEELSQATGASSRGLRAILNALVGLQFLTKDGSGRYGLAPESAAFLVSNKPGYHGGLFEHTSGQLMPKWLQLEEVVRTGKPAMSVNQEGDGSEFFEKFVESIFPMSYAAARALAEHLSLAEASRPVSVLDLAAGSGVWGIALAQATQQVQVTAVDWARVLPVTQRIAERFGVGSRFRYAEGDLLEADFGIGHQIATLGHILHSEGVERSRTLLRKVHGALASGGTIAIAEFVPNDERTGPPHTLIFAVNMLVNTDLGDTFTFAEMSEWLRESGFANIRQFEAPGPSPLILADKA